MVPDPVVVGDKPADAERATESVTNTNIKQIIEMDPNLTVVNPTVITTSMDDLSIITQNEDSNTDNDSSKKGSSNGL